MLAILKKELRRKIPWPVAVFLKSLLWTPRYLSTALNNRQISGQSHGCFVITFDVESANDLVHEMDIKSAVNIGLKSRKALYDLKRTAEKYEVPITLLCTGHALLESCDKHHYGALDWADKKHGYVDFWSKNDWFYYDPGTNCEKDPEWYFGDVVKLFLDSAIPHDIGSHTFGHIRCDLTEKEDFLKDMELLKEASKSLGINLKSHAFPWNIPGHMDQLPLLDLQICRWKGNKIMSGIERRSGFPVILESVFGRPHPLLIKTGIDLAIRDKTIFLWALHPIEIYNQFGRKLLNDVFAYVKEKRAANILEVKTLSELIPSQTVQV